MSLGYPHRLPPVAIGRWWGQPLGAYEDSGYFVETGTIPLPSQGGYKVHITVHPEHADELARVILPTLRLIHVRHKVVANLETYEIFNDRVLGDALPGKFITAYPGDTRARFDRMMNTIDPVLHRLRQRGVMPGPWPLNRQVTPMVHECRAGTSGMVTYTEVLSYLVS